MKFSPAVRSLVVGSFAKLVVDLSLAMKPKLWNLASRVRVESRSLGAYISTWRFNQLNEHQAWVHSNTIDVRRPVSGTANAEAERLNKKVQAWQS